MARRPPVSSAQQGPAVEHDGPGRPVPRDTYAAVAVGRVVDDEVVAERVGGGCKIEEALGEAAEQRRRRRGGQQRRRRRHGYVSDEHLTVRCGAQALLGSVAVRSEMDGPDNIVTGKRTENNKKNFALFGLVWALGWFIWILYPADL